MTATTTIEESFDPLGEHFDDPYPIYAGARDSAPIFYSPRFDAWIVTRYDDVREALRRPEVFGSANALRPLSPVSPRAMEVLVQCHPLTQASITTDGEVQRPFRALLNRAVAPGKVAALRPLLRRRAEALIDGFVGNGRADLVEEFAYPLALETIAEIAGLDPEDLPVIKRGSVSVSALTFARLDEDAQVGAAQDLQAFQRLLRDHLERRREAPRDDALGAIAAALAPGRAPLEFMQTASMLTAAQELVLPGHTTSVAMIGNALVRLLERRERWELLVERPDLVPGAVEEVARFDNPVHGFLRVTTRPARLAGRELPAGAEVLLVYASANRDEALCAHPEVFDLTRPPTRHLGFALGPHFCPGAPLGRVQVGIALEALLRRLPRLRPDPEHPIVLRRDFTMRGPLAFHASW